MDASGKARYLAIWYDRGRSDHWRDLVGQLYVPAEDNLRLLQDQPAGHDWYRLPSYGSYLAACCCGWCTVETPHLGRMLGQVKDHFDTARQAQKRKSPGFIRT